MVKSEPALAVSAMNRPSSQLRVSVVIPAFNAEATIAEAIASVTAQQHKAVEVVVVDDGSTDLTLERARAASNSIIAIRQDNLGPAAARNSGLRAASGEVVAFLDADDVWLPGKLDAQLRLLESDPELGAVYSSWLVWQPGTPSPPVPPSDDLANIEVDEAESGWLYTRLLQDCIVFTSSLCVRRSVIERVGEFDPTLKRGQDYDYWLRMSRVCRISKLRRPFVLYRVAGSNIVRRYPRENYVVRVLEQNWARFGPSNPDGSDEYPRSSLDRRLASEWFNFAAYHAQQRNWLLAREAFGRSLRYMPGRGRAYAHWLRAAFYAVVSR